jgi:copper chaperone CopZ
MRNFEIGSMVVAARSLVVCAAMSLVTLPVGGCASSGGGEPEYEENAVIHTATPEELASVKDRTPIAADSAVLYVNGLGCPLCATNVDKQLLRVDGVSTAVVNLGDGTVTVGMIGKERPSAHDLAESVADAGFTLVKVKYAR